MAPAGYMIYWGLSCLREFKNSHYTEKLDIRTDIHQISTHVIPFDRTDSATQNFAAAPGQNEQRDSLQY